MELETVLAAVKAVGWEHQVAFQEGNKWIVRLDTTDPDVHLTKPSGLPCIVALFEFPVVKEDQELLQRLPVAERARLLQELFRGWSQLGIQWAIREHDEAWTGFQLSNRIYSDQMTPGTLWHRVETVVDAGFVVRTMLMELRLRAGAATEPPPYPRRLKVEAMDKVDYVVVHVSRDAARWIHQKANKQGVSTEAVVDELVLQRGGE